MNNDGEPFVCGDCARPLGAHAADCPRLPRGGRPMIRLRPAEVERIEAVADRLIAANFGPTWRDWHFGDEPCTYAGGCSFPQRSHHHQIFACGHVELFHYDERPPAVTNRAIKHVIGCDEAE